MSVLAEFVLQDNGSIAISSMVRSDYRSYAARTIVETLIFRDLPTDIYIGNYTRQYPTRIEYEIWLYGSADKATSDELSYIKARIRHYGLRFGSKIWRQR
jgi:hypothetical protein